MKSETQKIGNYNVDLQLWQQTRSAYLNYPNGGPRLTIYDGIIGNGHEILARFNDNDAAKRTLSEAGFTVQFDGTWKATP